MPSHPKPFDSVDFFCILEESYVGHLALSSRLWVNKGKDCVRMCCFKCVWAGALQMLHFGKAMDQGSGEFLCKRLSELWGNGVWWWGGGAPRRLGGLSVSDFSNEGVTQAMNESACLCGSVGSFITPTSFCFLLEKSCCSESASPLPETVLVTSRQTLHGKGCIWKYSGTSGKPTVAQIFRCL